LNEFFIRLGDFADVPLFLMRLVVGFSFLVAARNKMKDLPLFAKNNGLSLPVSRGLVFAELSSGLGLIAGVLTQLAAFVIVLIMLSSTSMHIFNWKSPYWASKGGWEYDLMLMLMALVILFVGGGAIALRPLL